MARFQGKVVIVTGASSGIGESTAIGFAKEGANLTITGRNQNRLSSVGQKCKDLGAKVLELICDMDDFDGLESIVTKTVEKFGSLDILVNNAGALLLGAVEQLQATDFEMMIKVNVKAPIFLSKYALPHLRKTKGCIVNTSSCLSQVCKAGCVLYCATKAAVDHFTRGFALECAGDGVRVNCVNPGVIPTRNMEGIMSKEEADAARGQFMTNQPLGKLTPEDIAGGIMYLSEAKGVTGITLFVDGGFKL